MHTKRLPTRWAAALVTTLVVAVAAPAVAIAATGGASSFSGSGNGANAGGGFTAWRSAGASWYGPGLYGNKTACGKTLRPKTLGVAHKKLPCGTRVKFRHRGHVIVTRVIDRGPYINGRAWDLTEAASEALDFESVGVGKVRYAVAKKRPRRGRR